MDVTPETVPRHSASSLVPDIPTTSNGKTHETGLAGPTFGPSSNLAQYSIPSAGQFSPATTGPVSHHMQQTRVPIPQPPQAMSSSQVTLRPMQYQQQQQQQAGYASNLASIYSQPNASYVHNQSMTNQGPAHYGQQHTHARTQLNANGTTATNIYNPPQPPEVYTLPNSVNDTLCEEIRQAFQHDSVGRVFFFAGPPLDRAVKRVSPCDEGVGHSVKYLAGRNGWLVDREKKRRWRNASQIALSKRPASASLNTATIGDVSSAEATSALNKWSIEAFVDHVAWQRKAGLEGWRIPVQY